MLQRNSPRPQMNHTQPSNLSYLTLDYGEARFWTQMLRRNRRVSMLCVLSSNLEVRKQLRGKQRCMGE